MTQIAMAKLLPNGWLSLQISNAPPETAAFRVSIDALDRVVPVVPEKGFEMFGAYHYLPMVAQLESGATVAVTALDEGEHDLGDESDPVLVPWHIYSPERMVRHLVADCLTAAEIPFEGFPAWVFRDRMGFPEVISGRIGKPGAVLEVGVCYMTGETPFADSTFTDTQIVVPVRVMVKGDKPDRGQDAVDLAYRVREYLAVNFDSAGFGIASWTWSGEAPEEVQNGWVVGMQMSVTRLSERGECGVA